MSATYAALLLLVSSTLLVTAKRLPMRNIQQFDDNATETSAGVEETAQLGEGTESVEEDGDEPKSLPSDSGADDQSDAAVTARNIVHGADQAAISYISKEQGKGTVPMTILMPMSDGPKDSGKGIPYFYISPSKWGIENVLKDETPCTLFISKNKGRDCDNEKLPMQDFRCGYVILTGNFKKIEKSDAEYDDAVGSFFSRHPIYKKKDSENYIIVKFIIKKTLLYTTPNRPTPVSVKKYLNVSISRIYYSDFGNAFGASKLLISLIVIVSFLKIFK